MNKKTVSGMILTLLLSVLTLGFNPKIAEASPETTVYVDPSSIVDPTKTPGSSFTVDVRVSDVENLYSWQVLVSFDPNVLKSVIATEGDFLKDQPEGTTFLYSSLKEGWAHFACSTIGRYLGVTGSGTLATVEFLVVGVGESVINIYYPQTFLCEIVPPPIPPGEEPFREIPCIRENGYFNNFRPVVVSATVDVDPDTLNWKSKGKWITAYIELSEGYDVGDIDVSTILLNDTIPADLHPTEIGDYDEDGISDSMVKFDRAEVKALLSVGEATLTITGKVNVTTFEGTDIIRVIGK